MTAEQWDKVERLFEEALARPPGEREAFLKAACNDPSVRAEVTALLETFDEANDYFERLAAAVPPALQERQRADHSAGGDPLDLEDTQVGRYAVEEHLGGGGMGVVYRARDTELGRKVALKFLPPPLNWNEEAEERFVREARSAAALDHPNIGIVYEIGETGEGRRFIAMAYYEGETLKAKVAREGALPLDEAVGYATQLAEGLAAAHEAGIVHRDVKPANVIVTEEGVVKLVDFGLARMADRSRLTTSSRRLGTAAYMSPEQAQGEAVDTRADLWAVGVLLYEMLTGARPFQKERETAVLHAVLHEEPAGVSQRRSEVPRTLERIVDRLLAKEPEARYASAKALLEDLRAVRSNESASTVSSAHRPVNLPRWWLVGGAVFLAALVFVGTWWFASGGFASEGLSEGRPGLGEAEASERSVAVLPFEVSGAGAETWRDGMVTALSLNLDGAAGLRAVTDRTVFASLEEQGLSEDGLGMQDALKVAREIGARYAVIGSAVQLGEDLRFGADVHATSSGKHLGQIEVRGAPDSVTALVDDLTRQVLGVLLERSEERMPTVDLESITTESLPALKHYLGGERRFRAGEYEAAIQRFEQATQEDPDFALAYARLYYSMIWGGVWEGVRSQLERAYQLSGRLPLRERRLVWSQYTWEVQNRALAARDSLRRFTERYPEDPRMWHELGEVLFHGNVPGGWPEAERAFEKAAELDPDVAHHHHHLVDLAMSLHRDSALAAQRIAAHPAGGYKQAYRLALDLVFGSSEKRRQAFARLEDIPRSVPYFWIRDALAHPADQKLQTNVFKAFRERSGTNSKAYTSLLVRNRIRGGQIEEAMSLLQEDGVHLADAACYMALPLNLGYPISDSLARSYLEPTEIGKESSPARLFCAGIHFVESGRHEEVDSLLNYLRARGKRPEGPGVAGVPVSIDELQGYRAWKEGNTEQAARLWLESKPPFWPGGAIWRGDLYRERGQLQKAEEWYVAAWTNPIAHERLGRLHEQMGQSEKAQAAYKRFIEAWKDADPELQDRVTEARKQLQALNEKEAAE